MAFSFKRIPWKMSHRYIQKVCIVSELLRWIPRCSSNSLTDNLLFSLIATRKHSPFPCILLSEDLLEQRSLSTDSRLNLKHRYKHFIWVLIIESSPRTFLILWILCRNGTSPYQRNTEEMTMIWRYVRGIADSSC